jgi:hypothetical protein
MVMATTGELFLPFRVIYQVHDAGQLLRQFGRLPCMEWDSGPGRWTWNYGTQIEFLDSESRILLLLFILLIGHPTCAAMRPPDSMCRYVKR